ncbi:MAG: class I SAM-dependent methyltransferase [candidate division Zixibacteria bacterium]|nr:class I SAM-dependent methyltransferase [candidate division Zixibacteria bacterium]
MNNKLSKNEWTLDKLYKDPRHYEKWYENITYDIDFYIKQMIKYGDPVLELGCGTGRITIPAAKNGIRITGLDISPEMLDFAEQNAKRNKVSINFINADCRDFMIEKKFKTIFFPVNSILHLHSRESYEDCFSCVTKHLEKNGRFIFDVFTPSFKILTRKPSDKVLCHEYVHFDSDEIVRIFETSKFDMEKQINYAKWLIKIGDSEERLFSENNVRVFFPEELNTLLHYNGFEIEEKYGDFSESPYNSNSRNQIFICRKKP